MSQDRQDCIDSDVRKIVDDLNKEWVMESDRSFLDQCDG